jgi:hypothetical protein
MFIKGEFAAAGIGNPAVPASPEIIEHDVQVGLGGRRAIQGCIDDPSASFDGGIVAEIVRRFENHPGRIEGMVRFPLVGDNDETFLSDDTE